MPEAVPIEERARRIDACLAEIGYPVGTVVVQGREWRALSRVDDRDLWRAGQVAGPTRGGRYICFTCHVQAQWLRGQALVERYAACEAFQPFTEDCGRG